MNSKTEPNTKIRKLKEKNEYLKKDNSDLRKIIRSQQQQIKALGLSRDKWKLKNKHKSQTISNLKAKLKSGNKPKRHQYDLLIIQLCVLLRVGCGCSFRSIVKILEVLKTCLSLNFDRTPCANTIENWVAKIGLYSLNNPSISFGNQSAPVCLIIDENFKVSKESVMAFLATPDQKQTDQSLTRTDVEVVYLCGKSSWKSQTIKEQIEKVSSDSSFKVEYILSDECSKLTKAARLLEIDHLPDINHGIATVLRKIFKKNEQYQSLIKLISGYASKCVNQKLTYLRPPKQRVKARFMNQKPIIEWGLNIVKKFNTISKEEQRFFKELKNYESILMDLNNCIEMGEAIIKPLKEKGLNHKSLKNFKSQITKAKQTAEENKYIIEFTTLLDEYRKKYETFLADKSGNYNVSSDIIESLFGTYKNLIGTNPLVGVSLMDLELPVHCLSQNEIMNITKIALEQVFTNDLQEWISTHSIQNQSIKRREFFKKCA